RREPHEHKWGGDVVARGMLGVGRVERVLLDVGGLERRAVLANEPLAALPRGPAELVWVERRPEPDRGRYRGQPERPHGRARRRAQEALAREAAAALPDDLAHLRLLQRMLRLRVVLGQLLAHHELLAH